MRSHFGFGPSLGDAARGSGRNPVRVRPIQQQFLPERDITGRTPVRGVYLAGDGSGIAGADAAELAGERAALALIEDRGHEVDKPRAAALERALRESAGFRVALEAAFPVPGDLAAAMSDDTILCRCEGVTAGEFRLVGARARCRRDQPRQGVQPLRHGAVSGTRLRARRRRRAGGGAESAARAHRQAARPVKPIPMAVVA